MEILSIVEKVIGWVVLILACCYSIPQLVTVAKTKNTTGLSVVALSFFVFSCLTMLTWGICNGIRGAETASTEEERINVILIFIPNVLLNIMNASINLICLVIKIKHKKLAKKMGIDEYQLSKILLKQNKQNKNKRKVVK